MNSNLLFASDGSGGANSATLEAVGFTGGQVLGSQTIPRAQLWESIQVLSHACESVCIRLALGVAYVINDAVRRGNLESGVYRSRGVDF